MIDAVTFSNAEEAVAFLDGLIGNVLLVLDSDMSKIGLTRATQVKAQNAVACIREAIAPKDAD